MSRSLLTFPVLLVVAALAGCSQNSANQAAPAAAASSDDLTAIHTLRDNYQAAVGSGDPAKVAANFTSDAVLMRDGMPAFTGTDAIRGEAPRVQ